LKIILDSCARNKYLTHACSIHFPAANSGVN
jgi:hypothetical protein